MKQNVHIAERVRKIDRSDYNCGGYALNTFTWYRPYAGYRGTFSTTRAGMKAYVDYMIKDFRGKLREIETIESLRSGEYAIAFRTRKDDFHFCKRDSSGNWRHKRGWWSKLFRIPTKEVFGEVWPGGYNSPIVLLAMKEG